MTIPRFWAEARLQHREKRKQITVRRFGWSHTSEAEAQANATTRAADALKRIQSGEQLLRREPRQAYNGAEGVPIREEIIAEHGNVVITRNSYGALCLNTPDVLFADVDFHSDPHPGYGCGLGLLLMLPAFWAGIHFASLAAFFALAAVGFLLAFGLVRSLHKLSQTARGGPEKMAAGRIEAFLARHSDWRLRLYRTPAGLRVLAAHRTFSPDEAEVAEFFQALGADPMYVTMCQRQKCFRARVSPKPWRIGMTAHIKPRRGVWPVRPEAMPARKAWIDSYHEKANAFASCRFEHEAGSGGTHETVRRVLALHDQLCRAESGLPIA